MAKKAGVVLLLGRPNVGKSTFLNNVIGRKVSITSPKSQTTRFPIKAVYEDERGQLLFIDTPGIFKKAEDRLSKTINRKTMQALKDDFDMVLYMVDHTRHRDFEEGKVVGIIREIDKPVILAVNKIDVREDSYLPEYRYLEDEVDEVFVISALKKMHIKPLMEALFKRAKRKYPIIETENLVHPAVNVHSREYLEELIREKIYLFTRQEVPYKTAVKVEEISERDNGTLYIKAAIYTLDKRYKKMLIGREGRMVKEIGMAARKELELSANRKVFLDIRVEVDYHLLDNL